MLNENSIYRGAFWSSIGALFERITFFILPIFIAPLGPTNLGIFHISLRLFHSIVGIPVNALNMRHSGKLRKLLYVSNSMNFEETAAALLKTYFVGGTVISLILLTIILIFVPLKTTGYLALSIPFAVSNLYMIRLLQFLQRFKAIFMVQAFLNFIFQFFFLLIFIKMLNMGIGIAFVGQLLISIITCLFLFIAVFNNVNLLGFFRKIEFKMFTLPFLSTAHLIFITLSPILDILLVMILFGFAQLGYYVVLLYLPLFIHRIPTTFFNMFFHVAAIKTHKNEDITQISRSVFKWILIITMPIFVSIMLFPTEILSILFHKIYIKDLLIIRILAISFLFQSTIWISERILTLKKRKKIRVISNYFSALIFVSLSLLLTKLSLGLLGISIALLISSILDAFLKYIIIKKITNVVFIDSTHLKILISGTLLGFLSYLLLGKQYILSLSIFTILYLLTLWLMNVLTNNFINELKNIIKKEIISEKADE